MVYSAKKNKIKAMYSQCNGIHGRMRYTVHCHTVAVYGKRKLSTSAQRFGDVILVFSVAIFTARA